VCRAESILLSLVCDRTKVKREQGMGENRTTSSTTTKSIGPPSLFLSLCLLSAS
jgi:hypothetical protein